MTLDEVRFEYSPAVRVIDDMSLTIREGSIVAVVGPSGCGKSTLLSLLAGVLQPTGGRIDWTDDAAMPPRHPIAMLFQKDTLLPWLRVEDNVGLYFKLARPSVSRREAADRVDELLDLAGLTDARRRYPYQLSGGMRRRTGFLSAVVARPRTLLLDEPFSSLDEPTRVLIHQDTFDIVRRYGITVLLVTHDLAEALTLADQVIIVTARPARVFTTHATGFGDNRDIAGLRQEDAFLKLYGTLWEQLNEQIRVGRDQTPTP